MIVLAGFDPFLPNPGLALWTLAIFLIFWWLMSKFAFRPMMDGLRKREENIKNALSEAETAREEMSKLKAANEQILAEAREERATMLREAKETKASIISEAKQKAKEEATRISTAAKQDIENEKQAAMLEVKNKVGMMATEIAEKIIKKELNGKPEHESFVNTLVKEISLN